MSLRADVIACARSYLGVKWQHQGRNRDGGVDCFGLMWLVFRDAGIPLPDRDEYHNYGRRGPRGRNPIYRGLRLIEECDRELITISHNDVQPGDIGLFLLSKGIEQHLAIFAEHPFAGLSIIHAYAQADAVVECVFAEPWTSKLVKTYQHPKLAETAWQR